MNSKRITLSLLIAIPLLAIVLIQQYVSQSPATEENPDSVVARVGDRAITSEAFSSKMLRRSGGFSGQFSTTEQKQALLDEMINYELQVVRAREAGYANDPKIIAKMERIMVGRLREEQLEKQLAEISLSEAEIEEYYQQHLADYTQVAMSRIAVIQIKVPSGASDEKRGQQRTSANTILQAAAQLPASARGFGALAAKHSEHQPSRYIGGDIGWYRADKGGRFMDPQIRQAVAALTDLNQLSPVIETDDGYYLLKLIDLRAEQLHPLTEVQGGIKHILLSQKRAQLEANWLAGLKQEDTPIQINLSALEGVPPPHGATVQKKRLQPAALPNG